MQQYVDAGALAVVPPAFEWPSKSTLNNGRAERNVPNHAKAAHSGVQTLIVHMTG